ncbi:hypothetical protein GF336_02095 [Candidatus Woesearchaeota archaeon]|nr:hypothetical protein [Candidatus Woesearchaeota archaeon]
MFLFSYSTEHLLKKDKVRFYYALKGRDGKSGVVKEFNITQLGRAVLLVPEKDADEVEQFLKIWRCRYDKKEVLVRC